MGLDDEQEKMLADLKRKRGVIKASLTRVRTFVSKFDPREHAISLIEFRQEELPQINRKFDDIQSQIELIAVDEFEQSESERDNFETEYYSIRSAMQEMINSEKSNNSSIHNTSSNSTNIHGARALLAPIALPKFNGNILEWESFFDCFKVLVHNEDMYSAAQKFSYLRSVLSGQALDVIKGIPMTETNYNIAIKKLLGRYDNKNLVIQSHIRSILDIPCVKPASPKDLQELHSLVSTHVAALEALGQPVNSWDAWLITIIIRKLDHSTIHAWQMRHTDTELPKYLELEKFLAGRCVAFESTEAWSTKDEDQAEKTPSKSANYKRFNSGSEAKRTLLAATDKTEEKCICCNGVHRLFMCNKFKDMTSSKRMTLVRESRLCFNCLSSYHVADKCKSKFVCMKCKKKHNTLLHYETPQEHNQEIETCENSHNPQIEAREPLSKTALMVHHSKGHVFLTTAIVLVLDNLGRERKCRAVLDNGSQLNFISGRLAKILQIQQRRVTVPVNGIGPNKVQSVSSISIKVKSRVKEFEIELSCHVLPVIINNLPSCSKPERGWKIPNNLVSKLADPTFDSEDAVDLLIGGGVFYDLLEGERVSLGSGTLHLQSTKFGWTITGEVGAACLLSTDKDLEEEWKSTLTEMDTHSRSSKENLRIAEELEATQHFYQTAVRNKAGRFVLRLPVKDNKGQLGNSIMMATSRFLSVERRIQRDQELCKEYVNFMREYLEMGHMKEVHNEAAIPEASYYLPHHAVLKTSSLTTKLRVVFDASAKTTSGLSLNDILMRGPTVQEDIFRILTRFRKYQYVITADIEKMFRQIEIAESDWDLQRILWRPRPSEPLRTYRLVTVTYGTTPASFLATQCLMSLAERAKQQYPRASTVIKEDFYMDDLMTGGDTEKECLQLQHDISIILESAKLPLRKWCSNSAAVLKEIGTADQDPLFTLDINDDDTVKSLGLGWKPVADEFRFNIITVFERENLTKRTLLSQLNRIFDPLGFLTPVLIKGKIFLKQLWQLKIDWDTPLKDDLQGRWRQYYTELEELKQLAIPRKSICRPGGSVELHGFCDASIDAYGACVYVRSLGYNGEWHVQLLCSKTRVAPLKGVTIPRLELNGALLLAHLANQVAESWKIEVKQFRLWTDSMIVLGWLNSDSSRLKTYVANRVTQILEISRTTQWRHVQTGENPADVPSRGLRPQELKTAELWWEGPKWLRMDETIWKLHPHQMVEESELPERKNIKLALVGFNHPDKIIEYYSDWNRLKAGVAWLLRFIKYLQDKKIESKRPYNSVFELKQAERWILKRVQYEAFPEEVRALREKQELRSQSKLKCLNAYMKDGLILVGGRLDNANCPEMQKHPIVLPACHKVTQLIFKQKHSEQLHCGPQALLAEVRRQYWPLRGRAVARSSVLKCIRCTRAKPRFTEPMMAALPRQRVECTRPFTVTGVDFAGPLIIRSGARRVVGIKAWVAVFVCFVSRAIHLEVVEDLTSKAFIASLRRFMSRRGLCKTIYSDNGTNFVGAQRELKSYITNAGYVMAQEGIEWRFNPPAAPHFGGLWEAAVKSAKHHLSRIMGEAKLTFSELNTLLCQVEACVNSRPITPMSSDPSDAEALTPAHFLVGGALTLPPEPDLSGQNPGHVRRWKYVQLLMQLFWRRWQLEYLPQLQVRGKWVTKTKALQIDDIVIIKDENMPPTRWKLGRITKVHPGSDGIIRVATVRTAAGTEFKRPTVKLCVLPTEADTITVENQHFQRGEDVAAENGMI